MNCFFWMCISLVYNVVKNMAHLHKEVPTFLLALRTAGLRFVYMLFAKRGSDISTCSFQSRAQLLTVGLRFFTSSSCERKGRKYPVIIKKYNALCFVLCINECKTELTNNFKIEILRHHFSFIADRFEVNYFTIY